MDKQQQAPVLQPFFQGEQKTINPIWQRWFQKLKIRDDEIRRIPNKSFTADGILTTWDLGTVVEFSIGSSNITGELPVAQNTDVWAWITIIRIGTGRLTLTADSASRIEYSSLGGSIHCIEKLRKAANVTLQLISANQWAIIAGFGIWEID